MTHSLPPRPSWEFLRRQAKQLLRAARRQDPAALERLSQHGGPASAVDSQASSAAENTVQRPANWQLADAQLTVAREHGFRSWGQLKLQVEQRELDAQSRPEQIAALIRFCLDGHLDRAEQLLMRLPQLTADSIYAAACVGDEQAVRATVEHDASWLERAGGPLNAPPLVYACSSRFAAPTSSREQPVRNVVVELLRRGANPDAVWLSPQVKHAPLSALYGACGVHGNAELARLLLDAGATTDDNESLYHSVEHPSTACTELLLTRGAKIAGTNAVHNAVALGNVEAVKLFLAYGADVNERLKSEQNMSLLHWAIESNQGREMLELLLNAGADVHARSQDGLTAFQRALHYGHGVAGDLLTSRGAAESLNSFQQLLAACMAGDAATAKQVSAAEPELGGQLKQLGEGLLYAAAWRGNEAAVRTLIDLGLPVGAQNHSRATALHAAAWQGRPELVEFLLAQQAPVDGKETQFQCTPLEWALHGSVYCRPRIAAESADSRAEIYAQIVAQLIAANSPRPVERLIGNCPEPVLDVLAAAGIGDADE